MSRLWFLGFARGVATTARTQGALSGTPAGVSGGALAAPHARHRPLRQQAQLQPHRQPRLRPRHPRPRRARPAARPHRGCAPLRDGRRATSRTVPAAPPIGPRGGHGGPAHRPRACVRIAVGTGGRGRSARCDDLDGWEVCPDPNRITRQQREVGRLGMRTDEEIWQRRGARPSLPAVGKERP